MASAGSSRAIPANVAGAVVCTYELVQLLQLLSVVPSETTR